MVRLLLRYCRFIHRDLAINAIEEFGRSDFSSLTHLEDLRLSVNYLVVLEDYIFSNLSNLQILGIHGNRLAIIKSQSFYGLWKLKTLYVTII
ncbi:Leucine-rich repeat and immunoglobulin-like domain-containing nogo receptor-interacting protein 1 [Trichoplax sp. H2]|nr:Leucine-rich repeat and immunoglobulin-like domain-containing nogo receptor-interacting protein 1 [Trichoplax sp. H2]|eukprot:RDD38170.1 Leucine-rich repeat and immunoglobulin-like domain-containing nogo receptor-interacting protein 1 [Trichoplax sp. H2]